MTTALADATCTPCRGGVPPLNYEEVEGFVEVPKVDNCSTSRIASSANFASRVLVWHLNLVEAFGELAKAEGSYPSSASVGPRKSLLMLTMLNPRPISLKQAVRI